jgi:hypothetical protein
MFQEELDFFIKNQEALVKQYAGKTLAIEGRKVYAVYETLLDAYLQTKRNRKLGDVMIQKCLPGPAAYTIWMV